MVSMLRRDCININIDVAQMELERIYCKREDTSGPILETVLKLYLSGYYCLWR